MQASAKRAAYSNDIVALCEAKCNPGMVDGLPRIALCSIRGHLLLPFNYAN
jgi:hypothetical protein